MTRFATTIAAIPLFVAALVTATGASAQVTVGSTDSFAILAGSTITNTGATVINGNIGLSPGTAITGSNTIVLTGAYHQTDGVAALAQSDLTFLYNQLAGMPYDVDLTGQDLGGLTLTPGVYNFASSAQLTGALTLDNLGDPNAVFVFNIGSTLTTASGASIVMLEGPQTAGNVFFRVGSSATIGTATDFAGQIVALTDITLTTTADIVCGAALARNGAVTMDTNTITICTLAVAPEDFEDLPETATDNETAVGDAIADFVAGGGTLPPEIAILPVTLTPEQLAAAYGELAGEAATGVAPTATQAMDSFLSLLDSRFDDDALAPDDDAPADDTVRALGYGEEGSPPAGTVFASFDNAQPSSPRQWSVWAAGYGGHSITAGDMLVGSHDRSASVSGLAAGLDFRLAPGTKVGVAISSGVTDFALAEAMGSGHSDMVQIGVYGRTNFDAAYVAAAFAYAHHDASTDRLITLGPSHYSAEFSAHDVAGEIEAGYRFGWFTPYAALRAQSYHSPAYSETTESGVAAFALNYEAHETTTIRSELGARINPVIPIHDGAMLGLSAGAAWAHNYGSNQPMMASFQSEPGISFPVEGAEAASDALLVSAGAEIRFKSGFSIAGLFDGAFAEGSQSYAGSGRLRYAW